jgi:hypothetical protein
MDLNNEYESLLSDVRGIYSNYIIINQLKEKAQSKLKRNISGYFSDFYSSSKRSKEFLKFGSFLELKDSLTKPVNVVQSTIFAASLVFYLVSSYIMLFHDFVSSLNINYSNVLGYLFVFVRFLAYHSFEFFKDFLHLCYLRFQKLKNSKTVFEIE